jgi:hypothetical protein
MTQPRYLLIVTALSEAGTGVALLAVPNAVIQLLLGVESSAAEALLVGRVAGAALMAIGVTCWLARHDDGRAARNGVLAGVLIYDILAAAVLVYAGLTLGLSGIALWPAAALHGALALWCGACFVIGDSRAGRRDTEPCPLTQTYTSGGV